MNKRNLKLDKYGISGSRYKELCGFCEQYPEWQSFLIHKTDTLASPQITDMPIPSHNNSDKTGDLAIKKAFYEKKCEIIERCAYQADNDIWRYLIKSVCYKVPMNYLVSYDEMPCSKSAFYEKRRYFFYLLDIEHRNLFENTEKKYIKLC